MSSSDRTSRRATLRLLALAPMLALGGCLTPMYAPSSDGGPSVRDDLASVDVEPIQSRIGVEFRNALIFGLRGGAAAPQPAYSLNVTITSSLQSSIIDAETQRPQIDTVRLDGVFVLKDIATDTVVLSGKQFALTTFDRGLQRFAAIRAAREAENRAAELLAERIKTQIAIHFANRG